MRKTVLGAVIALAVTMVACGDGIGDVTTGSGPSATPTPTPQSTPTTPVATPTPTPNTGGLSCNLARLPNCDAQCCSQGGSVMWRSQLETAQADLTRTQPQLFRSNGDVRDNVEYMDALARRLTQLFGLCAERLGHDEIRIKDSQVVSQHIDVLISDVTPWVGGAYTCRPASF